LYSNLAATYNALNKNDSAEYFIEKAIAHSRKTQTLTFLATSLSIKADIFLDTKRESEAESLLLEVLQIRKLIGDPYYIVYDMSKLAKFYSQAGQSQKAEELCYTGIEMAKKTGLSSQLLLIYQVLADHYKLTQNQTLYSSTLEDIIGLKDSLHTINTSRI
jgi:tetratricopeptide (TPR) repeat protein